MISVLTINKSTIIDAVHDEGKAVPRSQLHKGDCLDIVPRLPDNSIACLLTDPPYGFDYRSRSHKLPLTKIANDRHEAIPLWRHSLRLVYSKLAEDGVGLAFTNWQCYSSMAAVLEDEGYEIKNVLIWEKNAWSRGDLKGNWGYQYEMVMYFRKRKTSTKLRRLLRGKREGNILKFNKLPTNYMKHPTEKPMELLTYLIKKTTAPGETVLDMFMGSGSTIVAAERSGRVGIGIELEPIWFEVAQKNLAEAQAA